MSLQTKKLVALSYLHLLCVSQDWAIILLAILRFILIFSRNGGCTVRHAWCVSKNGLKRRGDWQEKEITLSGKKLNFNYTCQKIILKKLTLLLNTFKETHIIQPGATKLLYESNQSFDIWPHHLGADSTENSKKGWK